MRAPMGWAVLLVALLLLVLAALSPGCARIYTGDEVTAAYERGYEEGYNSGYSKGYAKGYSEGYRTGSRARNSTASSASAQ